MSEDAKAFGPAAQPLDARLRKLIEDWRKEWESDERDYYAGQYSRADQHADQLEDVLGAAPSGNAEGAQALEIARAEGKAEGRREMADEFEEQALVLALLLDGPTAKHDAACILNAIRAIGRSLIPAAPGGGGK